MIFFGRIIIFKSIFINFHFCSYVQIFAICIAHINIIISINSYTSTKPWSTISTTMKISSIYSFIYFSGSGDPANWRLEYFDPSFDRSRTHIFLNKLHGINPCPALAIALHKRNHKAVCNRIRIMSPADFSEMKPV